MLFRSPLDQIHRPGAGPPGRALIWRRFRLGVRGLGDGLIDLDELEHGNHEFGRIDRRQLRQHRIGGIWVQWVRVRWVRVRRH